MEFVPFFFCCCCFSFPFMLCCTNHFASPIFNLTCLVPALLRFLSLLQQSSLGAEFCQAERQITASLQAMITDSMKAFALWLQVAASGEFPLNRMCLCGDSYLLILCVWEMLRFRCSWSCCYCLALEFGCKTVPELRIHLGWKRPSRLRPTISLTYQVPSLNRDPVVPHILPDQQVTLCTLASRRQNV